MSGQLSQPSKTELEIVIDRRMIGVGAAIAVLLVVVPVVGFLCFGRQKHESPPQPVVTQSLRPAPAPRADEPRVRFDPAAVASLEPPPPIVKSPDPPPKAVTKSRPKQATAATVKLDPPAPAEPVTDKTAESPRRPKRFKRFDYYVYENQQLFMLPEVPEFDLDKELRSTLLGTGTERKSDKAKKEADKEPAEVKHVLLDLAAKRADLQALPLRQAKDCKKQKESAQVMRALSSYFRNFDSEFRRGRSAASLSDQLTEDAAYVNLLRKSNLPQFVQDFARENVKELKDFKWDGKFGSEELAVLVQMLQVKGKAVRLELVRMLDECREAPAGVLLAQRAIFDPDADVREAAVAALRKRPHPQYRDVLLAGFRHPWPPVAAFAADALSELRDLDAAPKLVALLDRPDPGAPRKNGENRWVIDEMVSINHLRNCVLCHASSRSESDPGRSPVPDPGQPLPLVYYERIKGNAVRTDITYLRQDFSAMQLVAKPDKWPSLQRFDYVVRSRELSAEEATRRLNPRAGSDPCDCPQRSAVLFALREITGEDAGTSSADWKRLLSRIGLEAISASEPGGDSASTISKKSLK